MSKTAGAAVRGPYRTGIRRREQIVTAAIAVFAEHGFAGGSIRTIAERVGVSHATLLQYFGSKEGLLMAVLQEWDRQTVEASLAGVTGLDYFRRLPEVMGAHLSNRGLLELFTTIAAEATSAAHPAHAFIQRRYADNLATLATHLQQAIEAAMSPHSARRDHRRSAPRHCRPRRDRSAVAPRPLHRRHRHRRHLHQPDHRRLAAITSIRATAHTPARHQPHAQSRDADNAVQ